MINGIKIVGREFKELKDIDKNIIVLILMI